MSSGASSSNTTGGSSNTSSSVASNEIQLEGQLVDLITISHQVSGASAGGGSGVTSSNGGQVLQTPGLRVDASGMKNGSVSATPSPSASPSPTQAPDISASAGTYSRSGAAAGSSDASAGMSSSSNKMGNEAPAGVAGGIDPKRPASSTGTPGNTGNWSGNGPVGSTTSGTLNGGINLIPGGLTAGTSLSNNVRDELNAGVPPALVANGQAFVLVCDGKQLASMAGQTVRVFGRASGTLLIPDRIESRQADGSFKEIAFTKPLDTSSHTAQER